MKPRFRLRRAPLPADTSPDAPPPSRAGYVFEPVVPAGGGPVDEALLAALSDDIDATLDDELFPTLTEVIPLGTPSAPIDGEAPPTPPDPLALSDAIAAADLGDITDLTGILDSDDAPTGVFPTAAAPTADAPTADAPMHPSGAPKDLDAAHRANWDAALQRTQTDLLERLLLRSDDLIDLQLRHALAAELAGRCDELVAETRERFDRLAADLQSALGSMVSELVVRMVEDELDRMRTLQPGPPQDSAPAPPPGATAPTSFR